MTFTIQEIPKDSQAWYVLDSRGGKIGPFYKNEAESVVRLLNDIEADRKQQNLPTPPDFEDSEVDRPRC
jgi:hypothetical protein